MNAEKLSYLEQKADTIRKLTIEMIGRLGVGHIGGSMSIVEVLTAIFYETAKVDATNPQWKERDRVVLSKGHAGPALYSVLAEKGYFPMELIGTLNKSNTTLPSHCDMNKTPGIDMTAGSLGQGFSAAVGMAIGAKMDKNPCTIYSIVGDGESQEGLIWEASMLAAAKKLDNFIAFLDDNKMQIDGYTEEINNIEPAQDKWRAFGFFVQEVDGHDIAAIVDAINAAKATKGKPSMIILHTVKGKGAYFCEGQLGSHSMTVTEEQWRTATGKEAD